MTKGELGVIILSGGMDSTTLLYDLVHQGMHMKALSFNYHQRHKKELECAKTTCHTLGVEQKILDLKVLGEVAPSSLTRKDQAVPVGHYADENMKQTVVPNRNMVMLALATAYTIGVGAKKLFYGAHSGDHAIYPDCRPEFVEAMRKAIQICDWSPVELQAPYSGMDKGDIVKRGLELKVDYSKTWTCYEGKVLACGKCGSCTERIEAFEKAGTKDPIHYQKDSLDRALLHFRRSV